MPAPAPKSYSRDSKDTSLSLAHSGEELAHYYEEFTRLLVERREEILGRVSSERENLNEQVMSGPGDDADLSILDTSADYFLSLANAHQQELMEIRDAFIRLNRGTYGICQSCELPIAVARLRKLPYARKCVDCQSVIERTRMSRRLQHFPKL